MTRPLPSTQHWTLFQVSVAASERLNPPSDKTAYLGLERSYRWSYNGFVKHLHQGKLQAGQLYRVTKCGSDACHFFISFGSPSIWLFYVFIVATALAAWLLLWLMATPACPGAR